MFNGEWGLEKVPGGQKFYPRVTFASSAILGYVWCSTVIKDNISSAGVVLYELGCGVHLGRPHAGNAAGPRRHVIRHGFRIRRGFHNYSFRDPVFSSSFHHLFY